MSKDISSIETIKISEDQAIALFAAGDGLRSVVDQVKDYVSEFEHDLSTATSRKRTASLAAKVAKTKTTLDSLGKSLTEDIAKKKKAVDFSRKSMRDALDEIKIQARKPLTEWEEAETEKQRIAAELAETERVKKERDSDHELAALMNEKFDREREEAIAAEESRKKSEEEKFERDRIAHEEKLKNDAAAKAEQEKHDAILRESAAKLALELSERHAEQQRINAENARIEAEKQAKILAAEAAKKAKLDEIERQKAELDLAQAEKERAEKNKEHVRKVNNEQVNALVINTGLTREQAKTVVVAICKSLIPAININYV